MPKRSPAAALAVLLAASALVAVWSSPSPAQPALRRGLTVLDTSPSAALPARSVYLGPLAPSSRVAECSELPRQRTDPEQQSPEP